MFGLFPASAVRSQYRDEAIRKKSQGSENFCLTTSSAATVCSSVQMVEGTLFEDHLPKRFAVINRLYEPLHEKAWLLRIAEYSEIHLSSHLHCSGIALAILKLAFSQRGDSHSALLGCADAFLTRSTGRAS
jgi:hypothetical protein